MKKSAGGTIVDLERVRAARAFGPKERSSISNLSLRKLAKRGAIAPKSLSLAEIELVCAEVLMRLQAAHATDQPSDKENGA